MPVRVPRREGIAVKVEPETVSYVRTVHAASLLLIQAGSDRKQQETALRMIIEASSEELDRRGFQRKVKT